LDNLGQELERWSQLENVTTMVQAEILYRVYSLWDAGLSSEVTAQYDHNFYNWAKRIKSTSKEPAKITIENKITVYRDWVGEKVIDCPDTVHIPCRDDSGKLIDRSLCSEDAWVEVDFNPAECDYGKLLVARGAARRGEMTPEAWSALADPYATVNELKTAISAERPTPHKTNNGMRLWEEEGIIYARENGDKVAVASLVFDDSGNPLFAKAMAHLLGTLGLEVRMNYR
jgi:hypothetical protein